MGEEDDRRVVVKQKLLLSLPDRGWIVLRCDVVVAPLVGAGGDGGALALAAELADGCGVGVDGLRLLGLGRILLPRIAKVP